MGVTYKLKKEVVDFVVQLKKDQHELSCRQIAQIASQKFSTEISKSSINNVLKNSALSSHVGRRIGSAPPSKKFQIPVQRKKQIRERLEKIDLSFGNKEEPAAKPIVQSDSLKKLAPEAVEVKKASTEEEKLNALLLGSPRFGENILNKQAIVPTEKEDGNEQGPVAKKNRENKDSRQASFLPAGEIFIRIAFRQLIRSGAMRGILKNEQEIRALEGALVEEILTQAGIEAARNRALETIFYEKETPAADDRIKFLLEQKWSMAPYLLPVSGVRWQIKGQMAVDLTPSLRCLLTNAAEQYQGVIAPFDYCVDRFSASWIANQMPIYLDGRLLADQPETLISVLNVLMGKEVLGAVQWKDENGQLLSEITAIPRLPRRFAVICPKDAREWLGISTREGGSSALRVDGFSEQFDYSCLMVSGGMMWFDVDPADSICPAFSVLTYGFSEEHNMGKELTRVFGQMRDMINRKACSFNVSSGPREMSQFLWPSSLSLAKWVRFFICYFFLKMSDSVNCEEIMKKLLVLPADVRVKWEGVEIMFDVNGSTTEKRHFQIAVDTFNEMVFEDSQGRRVCAGVLIQNESKDDR